MTAKSTRFLDEINTSVLVGDGAVGTELLSRGAPPETGIERLNLNAPDVVRALHRDYIDAGSRLIETNTFGANPFHLAGFGADSMYRDIISAGAKLALDVAPSEVYVAGSVGPLPLIEGEPLDIDTKTDVFSGIIETLLDSGVDLLLFETFVNLDDLVLAVTLGRQRTDIPVIAQMTFDRSGRTVGGDKAAVFASRAVEAGADILGANCGEGVPAVVSAIKRLAPLHRPLSAFMNAGFPERIESRQVYLATPRYLAQRAAELAGLGASLIGGCCGTRPEMIRAIAGELSAHKTVQTLVKEAVVPTPAVPKAPAPAAEPQVPSGLLVELDPPKTLDMEPLVDAARTLKNAGISWITVADNPLATVGADVMTVAGIIHRRTGVSVIPHLTGRDRNRIALQSQIIAAHILGIRSMLCVTGDPVRMYHETNTSGVFDLTSIGLVKLVSEFNEGRRISGDMQTSFAVGVALNPNVRSLDGQINKLLRKIGAGAHFALTQPVFDTERLDRLMEALDSAGITIPVFPGILPLRSSRNAEFLHHEVPGIVIPDSIRGRLASFPDPEDQKKAGAEAAVSFIEKCPNDMRGFYLIAPRNRIDLVLPVIEAVKTLY